LSLSVKTNSTVPVSDNPQQTNRVGLGFGDKLALALNGRLQDLCACGRTKSSAHPQCPACARYCGPSVIIVDPDGHRHAECGLVSATNVINEYTKATTIPDGGGSGERI